MVKSAIKKFKQETSDFSQADHNPVPTEEREIPKANEKLQKIYAVEKRYIPFSKVAVIFLVFILVGLASFIRGSKSFESIARLQFCSENYWIVSSMMLVFLFILYVLCALFNMRNYKYKEENAYDFDTSDIHWTFVNCIILGLAGFGAGFIGSIIGVGGALIINPVLVRFHVKPEVMTATSTSMIVFTSSISTVQYSIAGKIDLNYALWTAAFSFVGAVLGVFVIKYIVEKYKRSSIIIMLLAAAMIISAFTAAIYGIYSSVATPTDFGPHNYCS